MTQANAVPIMEGSLKDFHLVEILQVLSVSRQFTRIELGGADGTPMGSIFIKSGKVVQAAAGALRGKAAFAILVRRPPSSFRVYRIAMPALVPEPIGPLSSLLFEALETEDEPQAPSVSKTTPPTSRGAVPPSGPSERVDGAPRDPRRTHSGVHAAVSAPPTGCIVAVASPKGGSGKTTVALNLALALARRDHEVILVDGDVNGDVMSSIDGRSSAKAGVFDVLTGRAAPVDALRKTVIPNLQILPAVGQALPSPEVAFADYRARWRALLQALSSRAEIVVVDTPAGMFGVTHQILGACTHVLGVLQAEVIAQRSFNMFADCLQTVPEAERPQVVGVFLNMLQIAHNASVGVLERACEKLPRHWLFETSIPRNPAFLDATAAGVPLHLYDPKHPPAVSWLFDTLATEVVDRLGIGPKESVAPAERKRFLA
jgi:chromosome partitioning protein